MTDTLIGPLAGPNDIEDALLTVLRTWVPHLLYVVERRKGLLRGSIPRPPSAESFHGGLDFLGFEEARCPAVIVKLDPTGAAERTGGSYAQWYQVEVGAVVIGASEHDARRTAALYGLAIQPAVVQHGSLGGLASRTELAVAAGVEWINADIRRLALCRTVFNVLLDGVVDETAGTHTALPQESPQYGGTPDAPYTDGPTVTSTPLTLTPEPPSLT